MILNKLKRLSHTSPNNSGGVTRTASGTRTVVSGRITRSDFYSSTNLAKPHSLQLSTRPTIIYIHHSTTIKLSLSHYHTSSSSITLMNHPTTSPQEPIINTTHTNPLSTYTHNSTSHMSSLNHTTMSNGIHSNTSSASNNQHEHQKSFQVSDRISTFTETVFSEFTALAQKVGSVNLGQGFPDFFPEQWILDIASKAISSPSNTPFNNQYTRSMGYLPLCHALAKHYNQPSSASSKVVRIQHPIDPLTNICITSGCTEALYASIQSFVNLGDNVIIFDPAYDSYEPQTLMAHGVVKRISLKRSRSEPRIDEANQGKPYYLSDDWTFDINEFKDAIDANTKIVIVNTTHNPTGKVFNRNELQAIADVVKQHPQITILCDDVYEELVYDEDDTVKMCDLLWNQTVTLGSAGKTFSVTGWKIGWCIGPAHLVKAIGMSHQWIPFCCPTPLQVALTEILEQAPNNGFFTQLRLKMKNKRDRLFNGLLHADLVPIKPTSGYFIVVADTSKVWGQENYTTAVKEYEVGLLPPKDRPDFRFARWLTTTIGVTSIPPSAFYHLQSWKEASKMSRFAFCKKDEVLDESLKRLTALNTSTP